MFNSILRKLLSKMPYRSKLYQIYIDLFNHGLKYVWFPSGFRMFLDFDTPNPALKKTFYYYKIHQKHEPNTSDLFLNSIEEGNVVVDIGANLGYFTLMAAKKVGRGGFVIAIEPEIVNYDYLMTNIAQNRLLNWVRPFNIAISDKKGKVRLFVCPYDSGHHTIKQEKGIRDYKKTGKKIISYEVKTYPLDKIITMPVNVIKIDAEGSEALILKGMKKTIKKNKELKLFIEFFPFLIKRMGSSPKKMIEELLKNFRVSIIPEDYNAPFFLASIENYKELMSYIKDEKDHLNLYAERK